MNPAAGQPKQHIARGDLVPGQLLAAFDRADAVFAPTDEEDAGRWHAGELNPATWSQQLLANQTIVPLIHHWLMIQVARHSAMKRKV